VGEGGVKVRARGGEGERFRKQCNLLKYFVQLCELRGKKEFKELEVRTK
jgi:hypothetical protein